MDDKIRKRLDVMKSVLVKMEDIKNTQQSLVQKIGQVEVSLFDIKSETLDVELAKVMNNASKSFDIIKDAIEAFEMKRNRIENEA
ncbi:hypothetical protein [uncultured Polaribacter sp.]|uniref:hypothetical protein n=1 Tax=uncultured Polaribacter sp. TaxID=174711 RepID=UPI00263489CE|nr:hypothetical protein [uncultured Polaribacter sp.]